MDYHPKQVNEDVTISRLKKGAYWIPTVLSVEGTEKESIVDAVIAILRQANPRNGSLKLIPTSEFTYNILFKYDGNNYYAYIFVRKFTAADPSNSDPDIRIQEAGIEVFAEVINTFLEGRQPSKWSILLFMIESKLSKCIRL